MKTCANCGRANTDGARRCSECGKELPDLEAQSPAAPDAAPVFDLSELDWNFTFADGFSRPDWKSVLSYIKCKVRQEDYDKAWCAIAEKWLARMAADLGGASKVYRSPRFLCLSDADQEATTILLKSAETIEDNIRRFFGKAAWTNYHGKRVILVFAQQEDYYNYISYYFPEGDHILSAGVTLDGGYVHIALPFVELPAAQSTLRHELVHVALARLPVPLWLNEGLAMINQDGRGTVIPEMVDRHYAFWNPVTIQHFWAGDSFSIPGNESELAYDLAPILIRLLQEHGSVKFTEFVQNAHWTDAGQAAALIYLKCDLGDLAGEFLGNGQWKPDKAAIAKILTARKTNNGGS